MTKKSKDIIVGIYGHTEAGKSEFFYRLLHEIITRIKKEQNRADNAKNWHYDVDGEATRYYEDLREQKNSKAGELDHTSINEERRFTITAPRGYWRADIVARCLLEEAQDRSARSGNVRLTGKESKPYRLIFRDICGEAAENELRETVEDREKGQFAKGSEILKTIKNCDLFLFFIDPLSSENRNAQIEHVVSHLNRQSAYAKVIIQAIYAARAFDVPPIVFVLTHKDELDKHPQKDKINELIEQWKKDIQSYCEEQNNWAEGYVISEFAKKLFFDVSSKAGSAEEEASGFEQIISPIGNLLEKYDRNEIAVTGQIYKVLSLATCILILLAFLVVVVVKSTTPPLPPKPFPDPEVVSLFEELKGLEDSDLDDIQRGNVVETFSSAISCLDDEKKDKDPNHASVIKDVIENHRIIIGNAFKQVNVYIADPEKAERSRWNLAVKFGGSDFRKANEFNGDLRNTINELSRTHTKNELKQIVVNGIKGNRKPVVITNELISKFSDLRNDLDNMKTGASDDPLTSLANEAQEAQVFLRDRKSQYTVTVEAKSTAYNNKNYFVYPYSLQHLDGADDEFYDKAIPFYINSKNDGNPNRYLRGKRDTAIHVTRDLHFGFAEGKVKEENGKIFLVAPMEKDVRGGYGKEKPNMSIIVESIDFTTDDFKRNSLWVLGYPCIFSVKEYKFQKNLEKDNDNLVEFTITRNYEVPQILWDVSAAVIEEINSNDLANDTPSVDESDE